MKKFQIFIERRAYKMLLPVAQLYWFIFRPVTDGAKCLIVTEGKLLLIQNTYHRYGLWNLPGGRVDLGEKPEETVIREVMEEVGVKLDTVTKLGEWFTRAEYKHDTVHFYLAEFAGIPEINIDPVEISKAEWFPLDALPDNCFFSVKKALEMYYTRSKI
ncbi:MAG: NUDIX hydrolase [Candidatus Vogelbacteria bacterium]|nr:NUDIX hydrolase [Candidatus Vogelbacteria bacterium]